MYYLILIYIFFSEIEGLQFSVHSHNCNHCVFSISIQFPKSWWANLFFLLITYKLVRLNANWREKCKRFHAMNASDVGPLNLLCREEINGNSSNNYYCASSECGEVSIISHRTNLKQQSVCCGVNLNYLPFRAIK